jgi:hypothetical protein
MDKRIIVAAASGGVTVFALGLVGCSGVHSSSVSGNRDDVKRKTAVNRIATRPTYRTDCASIGGVAYIVKKPAPPRPAAPKLNKAPSIPKVNKVPAAPKSNKTSKRTNPNCHKVKTGSESYLQQVSADKWCVELDNVNGNKSADNRWYTVTQSTYFKWAAKHEGDRVTKMKYLDKGC